MPLIGFLFVAVSCVLGCTIGLLSPKIKRKNWLVLISVLFFTVVAFSTSTITYFSFVLFIHLGSLTLGHLGTLNPT